MCVCACTAGWWLQGLRVVKTKQRRLIAVLCYWRMMNASSLRVFVGGRVKCWSLAAAVAAAAATNGSRCNLCFFFLSVWAAENIWTKLLKKKQLDLLSRLLHHHLFIIAFIIYWKFLFFWYHIFNLALNWWIYLSQEVGLDKFVLLPENHGRFFRCLLDFVFFPVYFVFFIIVVYMFEINK